MAHGPLQILLRALVLAAGLAGAARADDLSDGRFRDEVGAILKEIRPGTAILPDPDPAQIRTGQRTIALTNLYPRVSGRAPAERRRMIESFLADTLQSSAAGPGASQGFSAVKPRLRPQLVPREVVERTPEIAHRRFSQTLFVVSVLDEAKRYQYVTRAMIADWGVDAAVVEGAALENLAATSKDAPFSLALGDGAPVLAVASSGDDYDAARLLVPRYLEEMRRALKADSITVAVPTRDALMAWPSDSAARSGLAAEVRAQMRAGPYGRSDELFRFDRDGLRPLNAAERSDHGR